MPLINIQVSITPNPTEVEALLKNLSSLLAKHFGKPESYVMTALRSDVFMTFGGTDAPAAYVEIKNIGTMKSQQTDSLSQAVCGQIHSALGIAPNRIYIEFADAKGYLWGWNNTTFG
jgi:phenylpyruvate tautomerase